MEILYKTGAVILLSALSGLLYRMGGIGKPWDTKYRDIGCPLAALSLYWFLNGFQAGHWWSYLLVFGLSWGAMTTYWDWLFKKDNFYMHGAMLGMAALPLYIEIPFEMILLRAVILSLSFGLINKYVNEWEIPDRDIIEEVSRGVLYTATISLL